MTEKVQNVSSMRLLEKYRRRMLAPCISGWERRECEELLGLTGIIAYKCKPYLNVSSISIMIRTLLMLTTWGFNAAWKHFSRISIMTAKGKKCKIPWNQFKTHLEKRLKRRRRIRRRGCNESETGGPRVREREYLLDLTTATKTMMIMDDSTCFAAFQRISNYEPVLALKSTPVKLKCIYCTAKRTMKGLIYVQC